MCELRNKCGDPLSLENKSECRRYNYMYHNCFIARKAEPFECYNVPDCCIGCDFSHEFTKEYTCCEWHDKFEKCNINKINPICFTKLK